MATHKGALMLLADSSQKDTGIQIDPNNMSFPMQSHVPRLPKSRLGQHAPRFGRTTDFTNKIVAFSQ